MSFFGLFLPVNISADGKPIDQVLWMSHALILVLFLGWLIYFFYCLKSSGKKSGVPKHVPLGVEIFIVAAELALLFGFSYPITRTIRDTAVSMAAQNEIRVVAEQYVWNFHYSGKDKKFGRTAPQFVSATNPVGLDVSDPHSADDFVSMNALRIPVHSRTRLILSSKDVIHGFSIPVMRVKRDAIPGQVARVSLLAEQTGIFQVACTQLCGLGHYRMHAEFEVMTQNDFDAWMNAHETFGS